MTVIEDYLAARQKAGDVLNDTFFKGSTPFVFGFGDDLITLAIEQLSELSGIDYETIKWFTFAPGWLSRRPDGFVMEVKTPADLWDIEQYKPNK